MTVTDTKDDEKSFTIQTVRLPRDLRKRMRLRMVAEDIDSFQSLAIRLLENWLAGAAGSTGTTATVVEEFAKKTVGILDIQEQLDEIKTLLQSLNRELQGVRDIESRESTPEGVSDRRDQETGMLSRKDIEERVERLRRIGERHLGGEKDAGGAGKRLPTKARKPSGKTSGGR